METGFKKGIYDGEKAVNSLSEEIIKQKDIIRETQNDVSMLTETGCIYTEIIIKKENNNMNKIIKSAGT